MADNGVGNWRNHILIKCVECSKAMGYHKASTVQQCIDCKIKKGDKND